MAQYKKFNGKRFELFDQAVSKSKAEIVARRYRSNGANVRITKDVPSRSYNVWARGRGKFWL